jgi:hypothetical protein
MPIAFLLIGLLALLLFLHAAFPDAIHSPDGYLRILYLVAFFLLIGGGYRISRISNSDRVRYAGIWLIIILGLILAYSLMQRGV